MRIAALAVLAALVSVPSLVSAQCSPAWEALFPGEPGVGSGDDPGNVYCSAVYDDGSGPALYVGGNFISAAGKYAPRVARWDGSSWTAVNTDMVGVVYDMAVGDLGDGEKLYVVGNIGSVDGVLMDNVVSWDGTTWADVGGGTDLQVFSVHVVSGSPGALVVGGTFNTVGGSTPAEGVALWTGSTWLPMGDGLDGAVWDIIEHDGQLVAGGNFDFSGALPLQNLARWTGSGWADYAGGTDDEIFSLFSWGGGGGLTAGLYVGGDFENVGPGAGQPATSIALWDGVNWNAFGSGLHAEVQDLEIWDDGNGPVLYCGGIFAGLGFPSGNSHIARWNTGTISWEVLGGGTDDFVYHLFPYDDGFGESLWVGGAFEEAGDAMASGITRWDGSSYTAIGPLGLNDEVFELHASTLGGTRLWAGGTFSVPNTVDERHIAYWEVDSWVSVGGANSGVHAFVEYDDGGGPALYAAGSFSRIGGVSADSIARWTGTGWAALGASPDGTILAAAVHDDGGGEQLYVAGNLFGAFPNDIARWDGSTWSSVGGGLPGFGVRALETWDDGTGEKLYATGFFEVSGGAPGDGIAVWDGTTWSPLGTGLTGGAARGHALEVFDDGTGEKLWVGGIFDFAGGLPDSETLACWDGTSWSAPGGFLGIEVVDALRAFTDVSGCALYLSGDYEEIGGETLESIARWDGTTFTALDQGFPNYHAGINTLDVFDDGSGPRLVAGGAFTTQPDVPGGASYVAAWNGCWGEIEAWSDLGSALAGVFGDPLLSADGTLAMDSVNNLVLSNAAPDAMAGVFVGISSTPTPFLGGTLIPFPFFGPFFSTTSPTGELPLVYVPEECLPAGFEIYVQWGIDDDAAIFGVSLSNAVVGVAP